MNVGKDVLQASPWTAKLFLEAIEADAALLSDPEHARSAVSVVAILADHIAHLRAAGRLTELREYSAMLYGFLNERPDLPRLRDLPVDQQVAVRLDTLFQDLYAAERVPTPAATRELLDVRRGGEVRAAVLEVLAGVRHPLATQEVVKRVNQMKGEELLKSRQHAHQVIRTLREAALVNSASTGATAVHRLTALGRQFAEELQPERRPVPVPAVATEPKQPERRMSLLAYHSARKNLDPGSTGVQGQADLFAQGVGG